MTQAVIKKEKERCYKAIKQANEKLDEIRKLCTHENTFEGAWSWRIGNYQDAIICDDCGNLVKYKNMIDPGVSVNENIG